MPHAPNCVLRGRLLTFMDRPADQHARDCYAYWPDGALAIEKGKIAWRGDTADLPERFRAWPVRDHARNLILPGFIDAHTHFSQMQVIGSYGAQLMDWLDTYTYPEEARFADPAHARAMAASFLDELIGHGVTTAAVYATSHPVSATAIFEAALARDMCLIAGKVVMDRNAPAVVCDTPQRAYDETKALISAWHGKGRLAYAITPRFAITSTPAQMSAIQTLIAEHPDCYVQTHLSEHPEEIRETLRLFPEATDYTGVYEHYGLLGPKALFGHCIHLSDRERYVLAETRSVAVFCPSSNLFLGSGLFDHAGLSQAGIRIALGSDIGAGTSYSMLQTAADAYKVCQLRGVSLNPLESFYDLTLGNARALSLEDRIGTLEAGTDADLVVLDSRATQAMNIRMQSAETLAEELFVLQTLGDDRAIVETYIAGTSRKTGRAELDQF